MSQRRWSLAALALAPLLALGACDQMSEIWDAHAAGRRRRAAAPLEDVPLDARALSGSVQPQDEMAALLAPRAAADRAGRDSGRRARRAGA